MAPVTENLAWYKGNDAKNPSTTWFFKQLLYNRPAPAEKSAGFLFGKISMWLGAGDFFTCLKSALLFTEKSV